MIVKAETERAPAKYLCKFDNNKKSIVENKEEIIKFIKTYLENPKKLEK